MTLMQKSNTFVLQSFITIIMGVSLSTIIEGFFNSNNFQNGILIWYIDFGNLFSFIGVIFLLIRFYQGNLRLLYESIEREESSSSIRLSQFMDWIVILAQTFIFSIVGFFQFSQINFRWLICSILLIDLLWLLIGFIFKKSPISNIAGSCAAINGLSLFILIIIQFLYLYEEMNNLISGIIFGSILILSSILDYLINLKFYFPPKKVTT